MKALKLLTVLVFAGTVAFAQKANVETASIAIGKYTSRTDASNETRTAYIKEAKEYIDKAHVNETTNNYSKMWLVRGKVYCSIYLDTMGNKSLDGDAIEKALESLIKCKKTDEKGRYEKEANAYLAAATYYGFNEGNVAYGNKDFERAMRYYEATIDAIPQNDEDALKRYNVDKNKVKRNAFYAAMEMKDKERAMELLQELIDESYADPGIYSDMASLKVEAGDTTAALEYITRGRNLYEDNKGLIATELNLYLSLNKPNILIDRLSAAIESDPYNEQFYFNRGSLYQDISKQEKNADSARAYEDRAIVDYEKALEINAEYGDALYNLGALYVNRGSSYSDKANSYGLNEKAKTEAALKEAEGYYKKAVPYLELALEMDDQNKGLMQVLMQLYLRMEQTDKWKALKERAEQE